MTAGIGTEWVAPGKGATAKELRDAIPKSLEKPVDEGMALGHLFGMDPDHITNLALTGAPLTAYDLKRIAACE